MKKKLYIPIIVLAVLLIGFSFAFNKTEKSPFKIKNEYVLNVQEGQNLNYVLKKLKNDNIVFNTNLIKLVLNTKKMNLSTKPGKYILTNKTSLNEFMLMLNKGNKDNYVKITIPEGYTLEQIGLLLQKKGLTTQKKFIKACCEYPLPSYIKKDSKVKYALEGYLFPDTYEFKKGEDSKIFIDMMLKKFQSIMQKIEKENLNKDKNLKEQVIIASLIEREARVDVDRAKISSVIYNRLKKGMKLQIDASVIYALGQHKQNISIKDTKVKSDYNTYYIKGLPVGPICNPGEKSLIAAIKPAKTNYLFYLYKKDSTHQHYFTNSYEDFKKNLKKYGY